MTVQNTLSVQTCAALYFNLSDVEQHHEAKKKKKINHCLEVIICPSSNTERNLHQFLICRVLKKGQFSYILKINYYKWLKFNVLKIKFKYLIKF